jgi:hypothetical protein
MPRGHDLRAKPKYSAAQSIQTPRRAPAQQYWPALYFVDAQGHIRHHQFGEGEYEQSELIIQQLLAEAGNGAFTHDLTSIDPDGFELAADWSDLKSPESYIGYERAENFSSPGGAVSGKRHLYAVPARLGLNDWALSGDWTFGKEAAVLNAANGRIAYRFHAGTLISLWVRRCGELRCAFAY